MTMNTRSWAAGLVVGLALISAACGMKPKKVPDAEVDQAQKTAADKYGSETLSDWAKDTYPKVAVPADAKFKEAQDDAAKQKVSDKAIEQAFGDFQSMTYFETVKVAPSLTVYRFKGTFTKGEGEVRVVYDKEGKLAGFWIKAWKDEFN
jgi:hypothetical protein